LTIFLFLRIFQIDFQRPLDGFFREGTSQSTRNNVMRQWLSDVRAAVGPDVFLGLRLTPEAPILDAQGLSNLTFLVDEVGVQYFNWGTYFFSVQVRAHQRQSTTLSAQDSIWLTPLHATISTTLHCFSPYRVHRVRTCIFESHVNLHSCIQPPLTSTPRVNATSPPLHVCT
jgi:hypothetical protein